MNTSLQVISGRWCTLRRGEIRAGWCIAIDASRVRGKLLLKWFVCHVMYPHGWKNSWGRTYFGANGNGIHLDAIKNIATKHVVTTLQTEDLLRRSSWNCWSAPGGCRTLHLSHLLHFSLCGPWGLKWWIIVTGFALKSALTVTQAVGHCLEHPVMSTIVTEWHLHGIIQGPKVEMKAGDYPLATHLSDRTLSLWEPLQISIMADWLLELMKVLLQVAPLLCACLSTNNDRMHASSDLRTDNYACGEWMIPSSCQTALTQYTILCPKIVNIGLYSSYIKVMYLYTWSSGCILPSRSRCITMEVYFFKMNEESLSSLHWSRNMVKISCEWASSLRVTNRDTQMESEWRQCIRAWLDLGLFLTQDKRQEPDW